MAFLLKMRIGSPIPFVRSLRVALTTKKDRMGRKTIRPAMAAKALYGVIGRSMPGFFAKKWNGRIEKSCHMIGICGQSSGRGTW